ncbi:MAG: hypothetical protein Ct9H300mP20_17250 [Gammaproteobacteria bacterium]|nr:MAG: hypothetical protein Ct9H300mP20_17250 [Gammaproteobacteria bacterium]
MLINFPNKAEKQLISYVDDVAPILVENCTVCHREGGVGPWVMSDHKMVKGFSLMMREVIRTKRMPPLGCRSSHREYSNDRSLNAEEVKTLVHWIEAGAKREMDPIL